MHVRAVSSLEELLGFSEEPEGFATSVSDLWSSGRSGPELCFLVEEEGAERLGRVGFFTERTLPEDIPGEPGDLPEREAFVYGLELPWHGDWRGAGAVLLKAALTAARPLLPDDPQVRINAELHSHPERRREVVDTAGFNLFQEKEGVLWSSTSRPIEVPNRLRFRTMAEIGHGLVAETVSRVAAGTLDRNDRYYASRMAPGDWARVYVSLFESPELTFVGFADEEPVGFVAISPFGEPATATVSFIGVAQEHRGHRYVDDLLLVATDAASRAGFERILSDVDVENRPMLDAMERCGHLAAATRWHVWHYRAEHDR